MLLADVHAHLDLFNKDELSSILDRASLAGVKRIVATGIDPASNRFSLELAKRHGSVKAAVGLYPSSALSLSEDALESELSFMQANKDRVVAIGEIGLDYKECSPDTHAMQKDVFLRQLALAKSIGKPVVVHSRKAEDDVIELLVSEPAENVVLHCFMGNMKLVGRAVGAGFYFSIPLIIKNSTHFKRLVEIVPLGSLLTETDAPFLSPEKGRKSEPSMLPVVVEEIARIKGIEMNECANILFSNYQTVFERKI